MKRTNLLQVLLILFLYSFSACSEKETDIEVETQPTFEIDSTYLKIDVAQGGGIKIIPVETDLSWEDDIEYTSDSEWCKVSKDKNEHSSLRIEFTRSDDAYVRTAQVFVETEVRNYTLTFRQLGYGPRILENATHEVLPASGGEISITVTSNVSYEVTQSDDSRNWFQRIIMKSLADSTYHWTALPNPFETERIATVYYTELGGNGVKDSTVIRQSGKRASSDDVEVALDSLIVPTGGVHSESHPGAGIDKSYDGKFNTSYHSPWSVSANFPVTLEYFFEQKPTIDYIIYYPPGNGNGNFGEFELYVATEANPDYTLLGSYDFKKSASVSRVKLPQNLEKITKIKFSVSSGANNFVTCTEMQFMQENIANEDFNAELLKVFTDLSCSELKVGVTDEQIYTLPAFFLQIAMRLKNNTYDEYEREFRIRAYDAYSDVASWAEKLSTKKYTFLSNSTGIHVAAGDTVVLLVGDTHGNDVLLLNVPDVSPNGTSYFLKEGVNKILVDNPGMLFINYTAAPIEPPINIHIASGGFVDGFFDLKEHITDAKYREILRKATFKYFFVRGEKFIFYFHREELLDHVPNEILSAINLWDDMVGWQHELSGIDEYRSQGFNNHMMGVSVEEGYMWASDYRMGFIHTYLQNILLKENVNAVADNAWGPAHEMGHVHQGAINWPGFTEVSVNLFSNYVIYKLGVWESRGANLDELAQKRYVEDLAYVRFGGGLTLRMYWQLWLYYHRCEYMEDFWQTMFEELRKENQRLEFKNPGRAQMQFVKMVAKVTNSNLTDFFDKWGFFKTIDEQVGDYGTYKYTVTQEMIDETKRELATYPKVKHALEYIDDRVGNGLSYYDKFAKGRSYDITKTMSYSQVGRRINVNNAEEAVAIELKKDGEIIYFSSFTEIDLHDDLPSSGFEVYAVQADGKRVLVPAQ